MNFFDKNFLDGSSLDTKVVGLEEEAFLVSVGAMFAGLLIIEVTLEILIFVVEITDELEA